MSLKALWVLLIFSVIAGGCLPLKSTRIKSNDNEFNQVVNLALLERNCTENHDQIDLPIIREINAFYHSHGGQFFLSEERSFDVFSPLVISEEILAEKFLQIKEKLQDNPFDQESLEALSNLKQDASRFDGLKCQFKNLVDKKSFDVRAYFGSLVNELNEKVKEETIRALCTSFHHLSFCQAEVIIHKKKNNLETLFSQYQKRFKNEKLDPLFKLRANHQEFTCQSEGEKTILTLPIKARELTSGHLEYLARMARNLWQNEKFQLNLVPIYHDDPEAVEIIMVDGAISYVPDTEPLKVFLSRDLALGVQGKVFAHEIGHVLGFPDCYIEFFDATKSELVYYELSKDQNKDQKNLMCTLSDGAKVADDYLNQLIENSCKFN